MTADSREFYRERKQGNGEEKKDQEANQPKGSFASWFPDAVISVR
ncbi:MAG: hypothetical protein ACR2PX_13085 [Endozoicomonas sp.]